MATITIRIADDLRKRMRRIRGVNWSEVVRRAIMDRVTVEERSMGKSGYDSSETIRRWRDARLWRERS